MAVTMINVQKHEPTIISECTARHNGSGPHNNGDGRECEYGVDSENYSTNTLEQHVTITGES